MSFIRTAGVAAAGTVAFASATVLTFDSFNPSNTPIVPADYGDRVFGSPDPVTGYLYGLTGGTTPDITVDYRPDSVANPGFDIWNGYADLAGALGDDSFTVPGEVIFTGAPGVDVLLYGFDLAPWNSGQPSAFVSVTNERGDVLFSRTYTANPEVTTPVRFATPLRGNVLRLRLNNFGDWALDNITFGQSLNSCNLADLAPDVGTLDINDILAFASAFDDMRATADLFVDGVLDINDILVFADAFDFGCP